MFSIFFPGPLNIITLEQVLNEPASIQAFSTAPALPKQICMGSLLCERQRVYRMKVVDRPTSSAQVYTRLYPSLNIAVGFIDSFNDAHARCEIACNGSYMDVSAASVGCVIQNLHAREHPVPCVLLLCRYSLSVMDTSSSLTNIFSTISLSSLLLLTSRDLVSGRCPPFNSTYLGPSCWMRVAMFTMSLIFSGVLTSTPAIFRSNSASGKFGVRIVVRGNNLFISVEIADSGRR